MTTASPWRRMTVWFSLISIGWIVVALPMGQGRSSPPVCRDDSGRRPVIEAGREGDVRKLLDPFTLGEPLGEVAPGWTLRHAEIEEAEIRIHLDKGEQTVTLALRSRHCPDGAALLTPSFALLVLDGATAPGLDAVVAALGERVGSNDNGRFYRVWADAPPPEAESAPAPPLERSLVGTAVLLGLGLLSLLLGLGDSLRSCPWRDPQWRRTALILGGITVAGAILRWVPDPTFLREAYPLAAPGPLSRALYWDAPLLSYPQGPFLLVRALGPFLPDHGYDAWFALNLVLGILSVPAAFAAGCVLCRDRTVGLVAAGFLAFWPQHIRFVASESAHIHLIFWVLMSLAFIVRAGRDGRVVSFVAATGCAAALCITRPEAALWGPILVLLGLGSGDGLRRGLLAGWSGVFKWALVAGVLFLLWPQLTVTASDATPLGPAGAGDEALDLQSLTTGITAILFPSELNAFFDPSTAPLWLWPLAWFGAFQLWRSQQRALGASLVLAVVAYVLLYAKMLPAVSLWALGRYHLSALPAVVLLVAAGWPALAGRLPVIGDRPDRVVASGLIVSALGCALWWPAVSAFPFAWQEEQDWLVSLSREEPPILDGRTRLVTPDNRRRFGDLSPREAILGLSGTTRLTSEVVTVSHALAGLHVDDEHPPALFYAGLYCGMAVAPGEERNPQCEAMEATFELEVVAERSVTGAPWLLVYLRAPRPERLVLYRVGRRKLAPDEATGLIPPPVALGATVEGSEVLGTSPRADMEPPDPPL